MIGPVEWARVEPILDRALELPPDRRARFLDDVCAGQAGLRGQVESLLSREQRLNGFLEVLPPIGPDDPDLDAGGAVGPYRVVGEIARGGMGDVYLGERADGLFERRVAIKLLRPFLDAETTKRFEAERRILARLDHPGIARLLDAGVTAGGRPYLVCEHVEGRTIDRHCFDDGLDVRARLRLFRQVVDAVDHAHRSLLVHRDIKPSNVLVTDDGRVKLIDFGIAKLLDDPEAIAPGAETARTPGGPVTRPGRRWLTPEYAAPEQIEEGPATPATDVHQLGVLLYQLLTGRLPFGPEGGTRHALERAILETEPEPPSRLAGPDRAPGFEGRLGEDLDAIVLKALRKRPEQRYESARALAEDIDRCLASEPSGAGRARAARFLRLPRPGRSRRSPPLTALLRAIRPRRPGMAGGVAMAGLATMALALGGGAIATIWHAGAATRERDDAREIAARAGSADAHSEPLTAFLIGLFEDADPWTGRLRDPGAARQLLALGTRHVDALQGAPAVQAELLEVLARVHLSIGEAERAEALANRALAVRRRSGGDVPGLAAGLNTLGEILYRLGRYSEAQAVHEEALALQVRTLGESHPDVARTLHFLATHRQGKALDEIEALDRRALEIRRAALGEAHPLTIASLRRLGRVYRVRGEPDRGEAYLGEALDLLRGTHGPDHPQVAEAMLNLADLLLEYDRDPVRAESLYRSAMRIQRSTYGDDYPGLTHGLEQLARISAERGDALTAERLLVQGLELRRRVFGPDHPATAAGLGMLAGELHRQGRLLEAEATRREELALWSATLGPEHWNVGGSMASLARLRADQGDYEEAEALYLRALEIRIDAHGERNGAVALLKGSLARLYALQGANSVAESWYRAALEILLDGRTEEHPEVRRLRGELAEIHAASGGSNDRRDHGAAERT